MMNKTRSFVLAAVLVAASAGPARSAFDVPAISAQAAALAGAGLANRGDSAAIFLNPAAVAGLRRPEAYFMYDRLYAGLQGVDGLGQSFAAFAVPTKLGVLGVGYADFRAAGLLEERVMGVAFSRRWFDYLEAGVTGKYLYHRYTVASDPAAANDPVFQNGAARGAFALDFGVSAALSESLTAGLALRNLNRPDVGLMTPDPVPREAQASLAYESKPWGLKVTADYLQRESVDGSARERGVPGVGLEKSLEGGLVKFRVGATPDRFTGGVGIQFDRLGFDYAFVLSRTLLADNAGTHMLGVRWRFGGAAGDHR